MADKKTYDVHRSMLGDGRDYERGDTREMMEADAAPLVASGALSPHGKPPIERDPAVLHTFGRMPLETQSFVPAVADPAVSDSRVEGKRSPARKA